MKIYTKTGDEGMTSLVGGERVPKTHLRLEAYGMVDELNAQIGVLACCCTQLQEVPVEHDLQILEDIQNQLFVVGSNLATNTDHQPVRSSAVVDEQVVVDLEHEVDAIMEFLPKQFFFVLPGGCMAAAQAHVCRTVCRRTERAILRLHQEHPVDHLVRQYINRLSDYLFVLSRKLNILTGTEEKKWIKKQ